MDCSRFSLKSTPHPNKTLERMSEWHKGWTFCTAELTGKSVGGNGWQYCERTQSGGQPSAEFFKYYLR